MSEGCIASYRITSFADNERENQRNGKKKTLIFLQGFIYERKFDSTEGENVSYIKIFSSEVDSVIIISLTVLMFCQ